MSAVKSNTNNIAKFLLVLIVLVGFLLRTYNIDWDDGLHLHPDERMLIMVTERIEFPDRLNPDFFNYGTLPVYFLAGIAQATDSIMHTNLDSYDGLLALGRLISAFVDSLTILLIYMILRRLRRPGLLRPGLLGSFFYSVAFFPIQNSHFFIVDTFLTFFSALTVYLLLMYLSKPSKPSMELIIGIGAAFAAMITTKFTAIIFLPVILLGLIFPTIHRMATGRKKAVALTVALITNPVIFGFCALAFGFLFMPFAFIEHQQFISDIKAQARMNSDPFIFPYTLQYVGTIPYLYYVKNIVLWGLGPFISLLALIGGIAGMHRLISILRSSKEQISKKQLVQKLSLLPIVLYALVFFLVIGRSAVKFMRYMLPLYPFFCMLAGYGLHRLLCLKKFRPAGKIVGIVLISFSIIWTSMFMSIYAHEHPRITASKWIYSYIPSGSTLAVEHWDDRLPLPLPYYNGPFPTYKYTELPLYEFDTLYKWSKINNSLAESDYIIIASNRLYKPLMQLTNCEQLPENKCYPLTANYYEQLFSGKRGFTKIAEFVSYPKLAIGNFAFEIPDQGADESFTVYDHPKVMIYKRD